MSTNSDDNRSSRDERPSPLAHASCLIIGDRVEPRFWTEYFSVRPDISVVKGEPFRTPSGRLSRVPGRTGVWGCSSKRAVHDDLLDPHLKYLIGHLALPRPGLPRLLAKTDAKMNFFCFWANYSGTRSLEISAFVEHIVKISGATIDIDEYPQQHRIVHEDGIEEDVWI